MSNSALPARSEPWSGTFFSAKYFLMRALVMGVLFLIVHLLGLRDFTTFVTGTTGSPDVSFQLSSFYGMLYLVLYMGCVVVAPIFLVAAGLLKIWERQSGKFQPHGEQTTLTGHPEGWTPNGEVAG